MDITIIETLASQGLGVLLSVALVFYIIKAQEKRDKVQQKREQSYQNLLTSLCERFNIVEEIQSDVQ